jgi:hypothetical protein
VAQKEPYPEYGPFSFGVTGVNTSMAHQLYAFGWDMFDDKGDGLFVPYVQGFQVRLT